MPAVVTGCPPLSVGTGATESPLSVPWVWGDYDRWKKHGTTRVAIFADLDPPISVASHPCSDAVTWTWQEGKGKPKRMGVGVG